MYDNVFQPAQKLSKAPRIRPGGICGDILFTPIENVLTWPEVNPETGGIDDDIELKPGTQLYVAEFEKTTNEFTEETKDASAGHYHDKQIGATLPGNVALNVLALGTLKFHRFLVIFKDNEVYRFLGDEDSGAKIDYKYTSGDVDSSRNRDVKITWSSQHPAPIYQGSLTDIAPPTSSGTFMFIESFKVKAGQPIIPGESSYTSALISGKNVFVIINEQKILKQAVNNMDADRYIDKELASDTWTLVDANGDPVPINENDNVEIYAHD